MNRMLLLWMLMSLPWSCLAQSAPMDKGTREALKDAEYALRRFDEVTARIDFDRWHASGTAVGHAQEVLKTIRTMYIGEAEGVLTKLGDGGKPTTTE
jgi:hypothetical protein